MNAQKKDPTVWILCFSKSFPGKPYYFNVQTGEAVWTLNDHEKSKLKKETNIQKNNKFTDYPEPTTHPEEAPDVSVTNIGPNTPSPSNWQDYQRFTQYTPMLNQYMPMANTVMMPIQWPAPIWPYLADPRRPTTDKITQTSQLERNLFVQTSGLPLCKRIVNYEAPSLNFDKENKIINKFVTSTPNRNTNGKMDSAEHISLPNVTQETISNAEYRAKGADLFQNVEISDYPQNIEHFNIDPKMSQTSLENDNDMNIKDSGDVMKTQATAMAHLDSTDLRFLLEARKRKLQGNTADLIDKKKKPQITPSLPKKMVTFDERITIIPAKSPTKNNPQTNTISDISDISNIDNIESDDIQTTDTTSTIIIDNTKPSTNETEMDDSSTISKINDVLNEDISEESMVDSEIEGVKESYSSYTMKNVWYIVADVDALLDDHEVIEQILESYEACRLVVPCLVREDVESQCVGDCGGRRRIMVARQLTRRLAGTNHKYIAAPPPFIGSDDNTTDCILNCCLRAIKNNFYLVLISSDPYLLKTAREYGIRCCSPQEIKNGAIICPKSFIELNRLTVTIDNVDIDDTDVYVKNKLSNLFAKRTKVYNAKKKFKSNNNDLFIHITKPKSIINEKNAKYDDNLTSDISDQMQILNIQNENQTNLRSQNQNFNSLNNRFESISQKNKPSDLNSRDSILNKFIFGNVSKSNFDIENTPITSKNNLIPKTQKTVSSPYFKNKEIENLASVTNYIKQNQIKSQNTKLSNVSQNENPKNFIFDNVLSKLDPDILSTIKPRTSAAVYFQNNNSVAGKSAINDIKQNPTTEINVHDVKLNKTKQENNIPITTAAKNRIDKIISSINTKTDTQNEETTDKILKTPKILSLKNEKINTSAHCQDSNATDQDGSNFVKIDDAIDDSLKKFCIKNKIMYDNVKNKIEEWICTYTQIMEELLRDILQLNLEFTRKTIVWPVNLHESLTCIKMLYNNVKLRNTVEVLVQLLTKHSCEKGKLKLDITPQEFMKLLGCGVLFVENIKNVLPTHEMLITYENHFDSLLSNIESQRMELDPELLRPTSVCRSDINDANSQSRINYRKEPAYIIEYLQKHYKEWSTYYDDKLKNENVSKNATNHEDVKVVRMFGKNVNMLKIDNNKSLSYVNTSTNTENVLKDKETTKIIRLMDKNQTKENDNTLGNKETELKLERSIFTPIVEKEKKNKKELNTQNIARNKEANIQQNFSSIAEPKVIRDFNLQLHSNKDLPKEHSFVENKEMPGPKKIMNLETMKNKEPLDLDMLDFSEIKTVTADYSEKSKMNEWISFTGAENTEILKNNQNKNGNFEINSQSISLDNKINHNNEDDATNNCFYASRKNDHQKSKCVFHSNVKVTDNSNFNRSRKDLQEKEHATSNLEEIISESNYAESVNLQDIFGSRKNNSSVCNDANYPSKDFNARLKDHSIIDEYYANYSTNYENYAVNDDSGAIDENYATDNSNFERNNENCASNAMMIGDDSMNDSGFENMSTQAYAVVKMFLNELGTTFKIVFEFISSVVDEMNGETVCEDRKNILHFKASSCLHEMVAIIQELKSIIVREAEENTPLKTLLLNAGNEAIADERTTRYRQTVTKCLEQAEIFASALKTIVNMTTRDQ